MLLSDTSLEKSALRLAARQHPFAFLGALGPIMASSLVNDLPKQSIQWVRLRLYAARRVYGTSREFSGSRPRSTWSCPFAIGLLAAWIYTFRFCILCFCHYYSNIKSIQFVLFLSPRIDYWCSAGSMSRALSALLWDWMSFPKWAVLESVHEAVHWCLGKSGQVSQWYVHSLLMTGRLQSRLGSDHFTQCFLYIFIVFEFMIIYIALDCTKLLLHLMMPSALWWLFSLMIQRLSTTFAFLPFTWVEECRPFSFSFIILFASSLLPLIAFR